MLLDEVNKPMSMYNVEMEAGEIKEKNLVYAEEKLFDFEELS